MEKEAQKLIDDMYNGIKYLGYCEAIAEIKSLRKEKEILKEALRIIVKNKLYERYEQPLEQDILNEVNFYIAKAQSIIEAVK